MTVESDHNFILCVGGDNIVVSNCDDPHNIRDLDSEVKREKTNTWWFESMSTRLNDAETGSFVVVGQRGHEFDLSAKCRERGYVHLNLPARYDPARRCVTVLGWEDWRKDEGELLWPARFPEHVMVQLEADLGPYGVSAQLQQDPKPRGGAFIKRDWFKRIPGSEVPFLGPISWGRAWDLSLSKTGDAVASVEYGTDGEGTIYLRRGLYWHKDIGDTKACVALVAQSEHGRMVFESIGTTKTAGIECAQAASGHSLTSLITDKSDKVSLAIPWLARAQAGKVYFIEETEEEWPLFSLNSGAWIEHFLDRFAAWIPDPTISQRDDEIDAVSLAHMSFGTNVPLDKALVPHGAVSAVMSDDAAPFQSGYDDDFGAEDEEPLMGAYRGGMM